MIDPDQLTKHVIVPTLKHLGLWNESAVRLLLLTAAAESELGRYLIQKPNGPAMSLFQIEPATDWDVHQNFLAYKPELRGKVMELVPEFEGVHPLIGSLPYAVAIARCIYYRDSKPLPAPTDWRGLAETHKRVFNTVKGKATVERTLEEGRRLGVIREEVV